MEGQQSYLRSLFSSGHALGIGHPEFDAEGQNIIVGIGGITVVHSYAPPSNLTQKGMDKRKRWDTAMKETLTQVSKTTKPVIWTGDMNLVHTDKDIHPKIRLQPAVRRLDQTLWPGCTQEERQRWDNILTDSNLVDPKQIISTATSTPDRGVADLGITLL